MLSACSNCHSGTRRIHSPIKEGDWVIRYDAFFRHHPDYCGVEALNSFLDGRMALFGRNQLPHRSTLSRFLAALEQNTVEALRAFFQEDLLATAYAVATDPVPSLDVVFLGPLSASIDSEIL